MHLSRNFENRSLPYMDVIKLLSTRIPLNLPLPSALMDTTTGHPSGSTSSITANTVFEPDLKESISMRRNLPESALADFGRGA